MKLVEQRVGMENSSLFEFELSGVMGENLNYKVITIEEFQMSYHGFLNFLRYDVWLTSSAMMLGHVCSVNGSIKFYGSETNLVSHVTKT